MKTNTYMYVGLACSLIILTGCDTRTPETVDVTDTPHEEVSVVTIAESDSETAAASAEHATEDAADIDHIEQIHQRTVAAMERADIYEERELSLTHVSELNEFSRNLSLQGKTREKAHLIFPVIRDAELHELNPIIGMSFKSICSAYGATMAVENEHNEIAAFYDLVKQLCDDLEGKLDSTSPSEAIECYIIMRQAQNRILLNYTHNLDSHLSLLDSTLASVKTFGTENNRTQDTINRFLYDISWHVYKQYPDKPWRISDQNVKLLMEYADTVQEDIVRPGFEELLKSGQYSIPEPYVKPLVEKAIMRLKNREE